MTTTLRLELYVANVPTSEVTAIVDGFAQGYSYAREHGVWQGKHEPVTHVTVLGPVDVAHLTAEVAEYAHQYGEDSILVVVTNEWGVHGSLVSYPVGASRTRWERV